MTKKPSSADETEYRNKEAETVDRWEDRMLCNVIPETKESALKYWNAVNRQDASQEVKEHFKACMQRMKKKQD